MLYRFIGQNGSLGFITGQIYDLELYMDSDYYIIACSKKYEVPYRNMEVFKHNWEEVDNHTCLHCGKREPKYCEECYQDLVTKNLMLQTAPKKQDLELQKFKDDTITRITIDIADEVSKHIPRID